MVEGTPEDVTPVTTGEAAKAGLTSAEMLVGLANGSVVRDQGNAVLEHADPDGVIDGTTRTIRDLEVEALAALRGKKD